MLRALEMEAFDQLFGARSACAFGHDGDLRMKIVPRLEVSLGIPLFIYSLVVGAYPGNPFLVEQ